MEDKASRRKRQHCEGQLRWRRRNPDYDRNWRLGHTKYSKKRSKQWYAAHKETIKCQGARERRALKIEVLSYCSHNATPYCAICGIADIDVLCIDHINDDGNRQRARDKGQNHIFKWLKKNNYPEGFQVLCANCNLKKEMTRRSLEQ